MLLDLTGVMDHSKSTSLTKWHLLIPFPPCHALSYFSLTFSQCYSLKSEKLEKVELEFFESGNIAVGDIVSWIANVAFI